MKRRLNNAGYTLIEVLAAAVIIGVSMSAAVSLSATMKMQEEMSWRVTITSNYQENAVRLWQLGQTPSDVLALMPSPAGNPLLNEILDTSVTTTPQPTANKSGLGVMESAISTVQVAAPGAVTGTGAVTTIYGYRPSVRGVAP